ncbi:molybdopterin-guanine dinucleotide biosynthesis protein B [Chitinivorax tropicus]|uniref:Molybdopterin-guanine dinucleotide biosynthesis protein B n=1 Tax=Chitinivorax tropicus TaxID=714531 RepID=A0A840MLG8_9PROT|nr:molybdopterin-guanine dinucleotide biosynthesis protein B [Chitinivorax tropicus]MBB5020004.1 molybdopterin-guanine dinucleotide biosynthesis protein B [Chitinivorax tropicus]
MKTFGFAGWSGSGKTTLIEQVLPHLTTKGLRVSLIKHTHHDFELDQPGKDSWRHRQAGAHEVLLAGGQRWALLHELRDQPSPSLTDLLARLSPCDLVLVEGFKREPIPKLEVHRPALGKAMLHPDDPDIVAIACDQWIDAPLPRLDLNRADEIAQFILDWIQT